MGKINGATAAIAAQTTLVAVGIVVHHLKVEGGVRLDENESIGTNSKPPFAPMAVQLRVVAGQLFAAVVHQDKIVARGLVFVKTYLHNSRQVAVRW